MCATAAPASAGAQVAGRQAPSFDSSYASQEEILAAFGLRRKDLQRVEALGEASRRAGSDEDSDSGSLDAWIL